MVSKDLLADLPAFLEVADRLSFRAAAEAMDLTPAALSKAVGRLEARLGQPLMTRTTRRVALTPAGQVFRNLASEALELVMDAMAAVQLGPKVAGHVQVVAPASLLLALGPPLAAMTQRHQGLTVSLDTPEAHSRAVARALPGDRRADIALKFAATGSTSRVVSLGVIPAIAVAAPSYVARHGLPGSWTDPAGHLWLDLDDPMYGRPGWDRTTGSAGLVSTEPSAILAAAMSGAGIARLWKPLVAEHIESGRLLRVLAGDDPPAAPVGASLQLDGDALPRTLLVLREMVRALGLELPAAVQAIGARTWESTAR